MSRPPPRYIKLQDFPAHNGNVNCIKIGTKSSGVLVTGGDDKKVNLWTIGAQTKALSLQGHQTPVDSVTFDHNEEVVAAGASSGSIKLFDLDQAKVTRAMSGHRSNVLCLELSQYGLLSGSMDTNVKVWDLRGRDVMCTFKGHKVGVTHVKFSPDGKWVASASEDGQVKIWDLVANKLLSELPGHSGAVTGLHFHPVEYLLGTCSTDKTVKVWDLETMSMVDSTPAEATGVRAMAFHPDGQHVFSALQDGLRVWSWEPPPCVQHDVVDMPWFKVMRFARYDIRAML
ncbi:hypothetical protein CEUSTIGMA_g10908.t1 [Chlamydomonas eustigma]|uniref:Uncharacterized protein n=1 Tax=Chlamydomonas eustigma TaxID=1157962 RepID=A0A250XKC4_9CHLO|nr:hypothetical protein CEUSTIGMA_g10908.t1 [Chlamydomonas eustigma]|eukprot:GAX83483.1 hypothetical protein CEUSTIGMA_g10908.t1 [Chlamydomonas eustigma]